MSRVRVTVLVEEDGSGRWGSGRIEFDTPAPDSIGATLRELYYAAFRKMTEQGRREQVTQQHLPKSAAKE